MTFVIEALAYGAFLTHLAIITGLVIYFVDKFTKVGLKTRLRVDKTESVLRGYYREVALFFAVAATSGSLYMSEILEWTPCRLCWYQRIFMYPLAFLIPSALVSEKHDVSDYVIPLTLVGMPISLYNYSLERIEQFESAGCAIHAVSCSTEHAFHFGYINVPMMAFTAFLAVFILMWRFSPAE